MKFGELSEDVKSVIDEVLEETNLFRFMNIYCYSVGKQKGVIKIAKLNPLGEAVSNKPSTIVITVVEEVFEKLTPNQQRMIAEDAINQVAYDSEKDKITIESPVITMTLGGWRKYGEELAEAYETSALIVQQLEEARAEAKAQKKVNKKDFE